MTIINSFLVALCAVISLSSSAYAQSATEYPSMTGKTVLITGSTDGLGRETALRLGALGAHVLVHGRNAERGAEVVDAINAGAGSAQFYNADLGSLADVRALAEAVKADHQQLYMLINNAGIGSGFNGGEKATSADGYEMIWQVNYLSHYLLTDRLLPLLQATAPARVINVASGAQRPINFDDVNMETGFNASAAYSQSKLAQILHTFHMAEKFDAATVTFNTLHPATMMDTTLVRQMSSPARTTVDEGATALVNLAASPELNGRTGLYFNGLRETQASAQAYDSAARARLDALSRALTGLPPL